MTDDQSLKTRQDASADDVRQQERDEMNREAHDAVDRASTYEHGWSSDIEQDFAPKGLTEDTVRFISAKKNEPEWMLDWRLKAFRLWQDMESPDWAKLNIPMIDYQDAYYYAEPKKKEQLDSLDDLDPEIKAVYDKLGIPLGELHLQLLHLLQRLHAKRVLLGNFLAQRFDVCDSPGRKRALFFPKRL